MGLELHEDFWIRQIVFINSGNGAYVSLPLSETGALFGRNNIGKTSAISALKLFILPETSFKGCESKFGFQSNGSFHKADESFNYYLPSNRSFIICEAENPKGKFCIVLHRSNEEWGYSRIMVPTDYQSIQSVFWDFDGKSNGGFGCNRSDLNLKMVRDDLKPFKPVYLTKNNEIREAIYARPGPMDDLSRFCLIPLIQKGEVREVEALRALLNLAFDIKGGGDTALPKAVASIIESEHSGKDGSLAIDIGAISQEYESLKLEGKGLKKIHLLQEVWSDLRDNYCKYMDSRIGFRSEHEKLCSELSSVNEQLTAQIEILTDEESLVLDSQQSLNQARLEADSNRKAYLKQLNSQQKEVDEYAARFHKIDEAWAKHKPIDGINEWEDLTRFLSNTTSEIKSDISAYRDEAIAAQQLQQLNQQRINLDKDIERMQSAQTNNDRCTLENLTAHSRSVLYSLNPALGKIQGPISESQIEVVNGFTNLFDADNGKLLFLDKPLVNVYSVPFDPDLIRQQLADDITQLRENRRQLMSRIQRISDSKARPEKLREAETELLETENLIKWIPARAMMREAKEIKEAEIDQLQNIDLPAANEAYDNAQEALVKVLSTMEALRGQLADLRQQKANLNTWSRSLDSAIAHISGTIADDVLDHGIALAPFSQSTDIKTLEERINKHEENGKTIYHLKGSVFRALHTLLSEGILPGHSTIQYNAEITFEEVRSKYEALRSIFENYSDNLKKYHEDIEHHNNETGVRSAAVGAIADAIRSFEKSINRDLAECQISNLSEVKVVIGLDSRFESLRKDLDGTTFSGNHLLSDSVYQRLTSFCDEFFKGKQGQGRRVQLDRVITSVKYRYVINGVEKTAQQSHGTTGMINSVLLALLLKKMVPDSVLLHFPIVFDEVLSLDSQNLRTVKRVVEENNFVLFVACPENAGNVGEVIANWYDLSLHVLTEGEMIQGCNVLHYNMTESLVDAADRQAVDELAM